MKCGSTRHKLRKFIYKYAVANNKKTPSGWHEEAAGLQFIRMFSKRHKHEVASSFERTTTSLGRASSFNRENVKAFFQNLDTAHTKYETFEPENIFNIDERGLTTVQDLPKVYAKTGQKQVESITSASEVSQLL